MRPLLLFPLAAALLAACGDESRPATTTASSTSTITATGGAGGAAPATPPWLSDARILVSGDAADCRTEVCRHNENTDLVRFQGAVLLVHRTAVSQVLGPNSSLRVSRSTDGGETFEHLATLPAILDRDLRDPCFYTVNGALHLKALTRLPVTSTKDSGVQTIAVGARSTDGITWTDLTPIGPETWSFWRVHEHAGTYYAAAYEDGDASVALFSSPDGATWTKGPKVYDVAVDTPGETELAFMPSGKLLALVRMDGTDEELLGSQGRLRTKVCWSDPPYDQDFVCPEELSGQRLDGPLAFFHGGRLFVVARKHLGADGRKRTALFELTGEMDAGGALAIHEHGELPSAGDTAYAGVVDLDADRALLSWYSGDLETDQTWLFGMLAKTDVWTGVVDFSKVPAPPAGP